MRGEPVVVVASGPSLTLDDIQLVKKHGVKIVVVNNAFEAAPDYAAIVAGDYRWWKAHGDRVPEKGARISRSSRAAKAYGAKVMRSKMKGGYNSGAVAVEWCIQKKFDPVILLGVDCSLKNGIHFHGKHEETPNPNAARVNHWRRHWSALKNAYPEATVINCSRHTELDAYPVKELDQVLCGLG